MHRLRCRPRRPDHQLDLFPSPQASTLIPVPGWNDLPEQARPAVTGELETRWNRALTRVAEIAKRIGEHDAMAPARSDLAPISFAKLAKDLQAVWSAPTTDARLKKRIVRTVIHEAVADLDDDTAEIVLTIHWVGGAHAEHRPPRRRRGQRNSTSTDIVEAVRALTLIARGDVVAGILNRDGLRTGNGNRWTRERVTSPRSNYRIPVYRETGDGIEPWLNLSRAAAVVGVAARTLRLAAERGEIDAHHPLEDGPWPFRRADLDSPAAKNLLSRARSDPKHPAASDPAQQNLVLSTI